MDDATRMYLLPKRVQPLGVPYTVDKAKVLGMTKELLDKPMTGSMQAAFDVYLAECMTYLMHKEYEAVEKVQPSQLIEHDKILFPVKKNLDFFVKRKKYKVNLNARLYAEKNVPTGQMRSET
jgi:hypothetical protein